MKTHPALRLRAATVAFSGVLQSRGTELDPETAVDGIDLGERSKMILEPFLRARRKAMKQSFYQVSRSGLGQESWSFSPSCSLVSFLLSGSQDLWLAAVVNYTGAADTSGITVLVY